MAYRGKYKPKNRSKYLGDPDNVVYRSLWERNAFRWCDDNPDILKWNSEEVIIPYICETDGRRHRYFIDLFIQHRNGKKYLIEIKPKSQTTPPKKPKRKTKRYVEAVLTYVKNKSKWEAASKAAENNGAEFQVWTESTLEDLGIRTVSKKPKPFKPLKRKRKNK